jgi:SAM-dependent methyltransferase
MDHRDLEKAALRGEPSYVWREGQNRRLQLILQAAGNLLPGRVLENGCGVGMYVQHLEPHTSQIIGLEYDFDRAQEASGSSKNIVNSAGESLPFPNDYFDLILSHEVLEHVHDDRAAIEEMVRTLRSGGRLVLFCPNRGYPFETHGVYWRGRYRFGNIPLVNYLPRSLRNRLAPHVRIYSSGDLAVLLENLPVRVIERRVIFGAYDNIISRFPIAGRALRKLLQGMEGSPLQVLGLSHFWVIEKE